MSLYTHSMLMVIDPRRSDADYCKLYVNGVRRGRMRWDLIECHAQVKDCLQTQIKKDGRIFHRHVCRTQIDFN